MTGSVSYQMLAISDEESNAKSGRHLLALQQRELLQGSNLCNNYFNLTTTVCEYCDTNDAG